MNKKDFGKKLKAARIEAGYTQKQLAEAIGVCDKHISRYESGTRFPDLDTTLQRICEALGVEFDITLTPSIL